MSDDLDFGVILPQWSDQATPEGFQRIAKTAERCGFDAVWGGDHIVFPAEFPEDAADWAELDTPTYDIFTVLAYVAGVTESIRIGTNICVAPLRHPVHLSKLALSLDALSGGRFEIGVAVGWLENEYKVLDIPFDERGALTDEFLELFEQVCAEDEISFDGSHHSFQRSGFYPRPVDDDIKVWIGGRAGASVRRVAEFGDGWTIGNLTPEELSEERSRLQKAWCDFNREGEPALSHTHDVYTAEGAQTPPEDYAESPTSGTSEEIASAIGAYANAGATQINLRLRGLSIDERVDQIERFADEVIPAI